MHDGDSCSGGNVDSRSHEDVRYYPQVMLRVKCTVIGRIQSLLACCEHQGIRNDLRFLIMAFNVRIHSLVLSLRAIEDIYRWLECAKP
jgi:hypothetical protein